MLIITSVESSLDCAFDSRHAAARPDFIIVLHISLFIIDYMQRVIGRVEMVSWALMCAEIAYYMQEGLGIQGPSDDSLISYL